MVRRYELLKVSSPWELRTIQLQFRKRQIIFDVAHNQSTPIDCRECGKPGGLCDREPTRDWRHAQTRLSVLIRASLPRCHCPTHGVSAVRAPWERPDGDYVPCDVSRWAQVFSEVEAWVRQTLENKRLRRLVNALLIRLRWKTDPLRRAIVARSIARLPLPALDVTLPLDRDPPYRTYLSVGAHPLGILGAVSDLRPLLASDYINLACRKDPEEQGFLGTAIVPRRTISDFIAGGYCESFETEAKPAFTPSSIRHTVAWLVERIAQSYYVFAHVNEYYIPGKRAHLRGDGPHDALIVGCDTGGRVFRIATYFANGQYTVANLSFERLVMAITLLGNRALVGDSICCVPVLLAVRPTKALRLSFDRSAACKNLTDYLFSRAPVERMAISDDPRYAGDWSAACGYPTESYSYGMNAVATLAEHLRNFSQNGRRIDMRDTRALWEQKKILHSNMRIWSREPRPSHIRDLVASYAKVVTWAQRLHLLAFAYNTEQQREGRGLLLHLESADSVQQAERKVLEVVLEALIKTGGLRHGIVHGMPS
jgi:hypothetical protein